MKKLLATLVLFCASALGQTVHAAMQENTNTFTGVNQFARGAVLGPVSFASIGTLAAQIGDTAWITDGVKGTNPCTGGGTGAQATFHGGQWDCAGGGTISGVVAGTGLSGGGTLGIVTLNETNPMPTGVATGSAGVSSGVGLPMVYQTKSIVDVRDKGIDCTGLTDSSTALNTLLSSINQTEVDIPYNCQIRVDHPAVIQSQSSFVIRGLGHKPFAGGYGGPSIYGCNGTTGPVLYINRSGYGRIEGLGIYAKGPGSVCASSGFTQSVQVDSTGNPGVTTHNIIFDGVSFTTSPQGGTVTNYVGLSITDGGKQNGEFIQVKNSIIHCQNSSNSNGILLANGTSDTDVFEYNNIASCYIGIYHAAGQALIKKNLFSSDGDFSVFGANGAAIRVDSCSAGPVNIEDNEADTIGDFINSSNDAAGGGCNSGFNISGNIIGVADPTPNNYVINIGNTNSAVFYNLIGNQFLVQSNTSQYLVGSSSQLPFGPLGYLYDINNSMRAPTGSNSLGFSNLSQPFQQGEYHTPISFFGNANDLTWGPDATQPEISTYNRIMRANPVNGAFGQQSPFLAFRAWTGTINDDWAFEATASGTTSQLTLSHTNGTSTNNWFVHDGKTSGLTVATMSNPIAPGLAIRGTGGSTTYGYSVVDFGPNGNTLASTTASTTSGNATLNSTNYISVQFGAVLGATKVCVRREVGGATQGYIGCVPIAGGVIGTPNPGNQLNQWILQLNDQGLVADGSAAPSLNTTGFADFSAASQMKAPALAGYASLANGELGYNTTDLNWHLWQNGADRLMAVINGAVTNGDCAKFVVSGSTVSVQDNGTTCGGGGGGSPGGSSLSSQYNNGGVLAGTTLGVNQGTYYFGRVNTTQGTATAPVEIQKGDCSGPGTISGATTTYTVAYTDVVGCTIVHDRAASGAATVTVPTPTTLNNPLPYFTYANYSPQDDTLSPTTYTISHGTTVAASTLTVHSGFSCKVNLDPVNASTWKADCHQMAAVFTGGPGGSTLSFQYNNLGVLAGITNGTNKGIYIPARVNGTHGTPSTPTELQMGDCLTPGTITGAGTTYTIVYTDVVNCTVRHDIAGSQSATITIPTPTTLDNPAPIFTYENDSTHADTLSPTTYTISLGGAAAASTLSVPANVSCDVKLDPVNASTWKANCHPITTSAGASAITTVGLGGVWTNGMPLGMPVGAGTNVTPVNTTMYFQQVTLVRQQVVGNATFNTITCASCAEVVNACIYDKTATSLLWSGVSSTFNATGAFSANGTQATLQPDVYYFAYSFSGTTAPVVSGYTPGASGTDNILNKNGTREGTAANGISGGNCPSSLGTLTPTTTLPAHAAFALEP